MQVELRISDWKVKAPAKDETDPVITGHYELMMGDICIAKQEFNDGYSTKKLGFSSKLIERVKTLEQEIAEEVKAVLN